MSTANEGIAPVRTSIHRTPHDALELPGGYRLGDVQDAELVRILIVACVPGVSSENGRATNAEAYAAHLKLIQDEGARSALAKWFTHARAV